MLIEALAALAIVVQDQAALRNAPQPGAPKQATLWQGDTVEVRGARLDYLQVYDHRRERAGFVLATQVRQISTEPAAAAGLLAVLRFLRDTPGSEALGIAYAAAYLKAAPGPELTAEPFVALGVMADRLAMRASARTGNPARLAEQLEVAQTYGVHFDSFERDDRMQLCYDGDGFTRAFGLPASPEEQAQAALALTRHECVDPALAPLEADIVNAWRAKVLDRLDLAALSPLARNRVRIRRAGVWAGLAFAATRAGEPGQEAGERALHELASVLDADLTDGDRTAYTDAAVRVGASRWAAEPVVTAAAGGLRVATRPGQPGETCILLLDARTDESKPLLRRCTWGTVWAASASSHPAGTALALAVQPLAGWRELWLFRKDKAGWSVSVLPPAARNPDVGYAEFAGWVAGKPQVLVVRESQEYGAWRRSFEVVSIHSLAVVRRADNPEHLSAFYRWQSPAWKQLTVSLR